MKRLLAFGLMIAMVLASTTASGGSRYINVRYGYSLALPHHFSVLYESANGDGGVSRSEDGQAELRVFGAHILDGSFSDEATRRIESDKADGWDITYVAAKPQFTSYSGSKAGRVLYVRMISACQGTAVLAQLEYPATELSKFDDIVKNLVHSLKASQTNC